MLRRKARRSRIGRPWLSGCLFVASLAGIAATARAVPTLETLASFGGANGAYPRGGVIADADDNLYGTTSGGGEGQWGTVFRLDAGSNALTTLEFYDGNNGIYAYDGLVADAAGNLYGTTHSGGAFGRGNVFRVDAGFNAITTLASFTGSNGRFPYARLLIDAAGNLYGTTSGDTMFGGASGGYGTVFRLNAGTNVITTLASFNGSNGRFPFAGLIADAAGNLYGTTRQGGALSNIDGGFGTVFRLDAGTNTITMLASFDGSNGAYPVGRLLADTAGNLYGTTSGGGASNMGTVFRLDAATNALTTLVSFDGSNGSDPMSDLIADAAGNLYGTTYAGGAFGYGTVFRLDVATNALATLVSFNGSNGSGSTAGLIADAAGNLYGTTSGEGGASGGYGTVFRLSGAGFVVPEPAGAMGLLVAMLAVSSLPPRLTVRMRRRTA